MKLWYFFRQIANGAWLSPVERLLREQEAGGSNPLAPTIKEKARQSVVIAGLLFVLEVSRRV